MARIKLKCSCGWSFFVAGTTQASQVACPNCNGFVPIPGKDDVGSPLSAGQLASKTRTRAKMIRLLVGMSAGLVVVIVLLVVVLSGGEEEPRRRTVRRSAPPPAAGEETPATSEPDAEPAETTAPATTPKKKKKPAASSSPSTPFMDDARIAAMKDETYGGHWLVNMSGIVAEAMRVRGLGDDHTAMVERMKAYHEKLNEKLQKLGRVGVTVRLDGRMMPGDRIYSLAGRPVAELPPAEGLYVLQSWLEEFTTPKLGVNCVVLRDGQQIPLQFSFVKGSGELMELARYPKQVEGGLTAVPPGSTPRVAGAPAGASGTMEIPANVVRPLGARLKELPEGYLTLLDPSERTRLDTLLKNPEGNSSDIAFLRDRMLGTVLPLLEKDLADIRARAGELEASVLKEAVAVDVVHFKTGRKVEGKVVEETETHVKIKSRFGAVQFPKSEIARIEKGAGAGGEFPGKYAAAKGKPAELAKLLGWCQLKNLRVEREFVACRMLELDPANALARREARRPAPEIPVAAAPAVPAVETAGDAAATREIDLIAADVVLKQSSLNAVIRDMRTRTAHLTRGVAPVAPARSLGLASYVKNPMDFQPNSLTGAQALEMGNIWGSLGPAERKDFARYIGMWCAYLRHQAARNDR